MDGAPRDGASGSFDEELADGDGVRIDLIALALQDGEEDQVFEFAHGRGGR